MNDQCATRSEDHQQGLSVKLAISPTPADDFAPEPATDPPHAPRSPRSAGARAWSRIWAGAARWVDALWGYDVFIAHRRADAASYAQELHERLKAEGISSFIDRVFYVPGNSLLVSTERHIARSNMLLLLGSPELLVRRRPTDWVEREVAAYLKRHPQGAMTEEKEATPFNTANLLVVDFGGVIAGTRSGPDMPSFFDQLANFLRVEELASALGEPPSNQVVAAIRANLGSRRRDVTRLRLFQGIALGLMLLLATVALTGIVALNNGVSAARTAAAADLRASLERAIERPDEAALLAARALDTVTRPWLLAPFLQRDQRRVREVLGAIRLPDSDIHRTGGRVASMELSPDGTDLVVWTERSRLICFDSATMTQRFSIDLAGVGPSATLAVMNGTIMLSEGNPLRVLLLDRVGSIRLDRTFGDNEDVYPVTGAAMLLRRKPATGLELLDLGAGTARPLASGETGSIQYAKWLPGLDRLVAHTATSELGAYEERIFSVADGALVGPVRVTYSLGPAASVADVGAHIYRITDERHVDVIDLRSGQSVENLPGASGLPVYNVWPSPNGEWFVVSSGLGMNAIEALDSATNRPIARPLTFPLEEEPAFSPSGDVLALPGDREVMVIDRRKPEEIRRLPLDSPGKAVQFIDDRTLAIATSEGRVEIWNVETGELRERGIRHPEGHVQLAALPDGRLATAGWDGTVRATRIGIGTPAWSHSWPSSEPSPAIVGLSPHPTEDAVAVVTNTGHGALCQIGAAACVWDLDLGHELLSVTFLDNGRTVLFGHKGGGFNIRDAVSGLPLASADDGLVVGDRVRPVIALARNGEPLELRGASADLPLLCRSNQSLTSPSVLAISDDGEFVLAVTGDTAKPHRLIAFDTRSCTEMWARDVDAGTSVLAASGRFGLVAAGGERGTALYGLTDGAPRGRPLEDRNMARSLLFHPEQPLLLVTNFSRWIVGYDVRREQQRFTPFEAGAIPWETAFSQSGETFVVAFITADREGRFTVWRYDAELGRPVAPPMSHPKDVMSVALTASGSWIVTGATDGVVRAWPTGSEERASADVLAAIARVTGETIDDVSGAIHSAVSADPAMAASAR